MLFVVAKIFGLLATPGNALLLLCVAGCLLRLLRSRYGRSRRVGMALIYVGVAGFAAIAVLPLDRLLIAPLENRFAGQRYPAHVDGIIVLGGAVDVQRTFEHGMPALNWAAERMTTAVALALRYPDARLVFSGGNGSLFPGGGTEAMVARQLFTSLGIDPARVTYEDASRTTYENAVESYKLIDPDPDEVWLLVTSANHMPRAIGVFRRVGWDVIPWPVAYKSPMRDSFAVFGTLSGHLQVFELAFHEWLGLIAYYVTGRSDALFPAP